MSPLMGPKSPELVIANTFRLVTNDAWIALPAMKEPALLLPVAIAAIIGLIIFGFLALEVVFHIG